MPVDDEALRAREQVLPEHHEQACPGVLEPPEPMLRVAPVDDPPHELPALLPDDGQEGLVDGPGLLVVGEDASMQVYDLPVFEVPIRVGRQRLEQLVAEEQPGAMQ
jgi:hypothetical protein